jgi:RecA/RadA recombinase
MSTLLEKLKSSGSIDSQSLDESKLFTDRDLTTTAVPIINIALSGKLDGGLTSGLTVLAGPSKHFKSSLGLIMISAYMKKHKDAVCLFYDNEFGITTEYVEAQGIDSNRVVHIPIENIEEFKFDISQRLQDVKKGDKVILFVDSLGNLASKKELDDAIDGKSVSDMTRAKAMKSVFRILTPLLTTKDIPCIAICHTYLEQSLFPKQIVSGGTGIYYSSNSIFIIGRQQEKDAKEVIGWNFTLNVEKSRFVKEKSKLTFSVTYEKGVERWSGLLDIAEQGKFITKPKKGKFARVTKDGEVEEQMFSEDQTKTLDFWKPILQNKIFQKYIQDTYRLESTIGSTDEYNETIGDIINATE